MLEDAYIDTFRKKLNALGGPLVTIAYGGAFVYYGIVNTTVPEAPLYYKLGFATVVNAILMPYEFIFGTFMGLMCARTLPTERLKLKRDLESKVQ